MQSKSLVKQSDTVLSLPLDCRKDWTLLRDDSIFVDWQRLKVQENVEEVCCSPTILE